MNPRTIKTLITLLKYIESTADYNQSHNAKVMGYTELEEQFNIGPNQTSASVTDIAAGKLRNAFGLYKPKAGQEVQIADLKGARYILSYLGEGQYRVTVTRKNWWYLHTRQEAVQHNLPVEASHANAPAQ